MCDGLTYCLLGYDEAVQQAEVCDMLAHCQLGYDETACGACPPYCVHHAKVCDGFPYCPLGYDVARGRRAKGDDNS